MKEEEVARDTEEWGGGGMWIGGLRQATGNNTKSPTDKGDEGNPETIDKRAQAEAVGSPSTDPRTAGELAPTDTKARDGATENPQ
jgi:hypothetical protein